MVFQFLRHLSLATGGNMTAHVEETQWFILFVTEGIESLDGRGGVVAGNLARLLKRQSIKPHWRHSDGPIFVSVTSMKHKIPN